MARKFEERAEAYLLSVVEGRRPGTWAAFLRMLLGGLSHVFSLVVQVRLWCYKHGLLKHHTLGCQVVSVGNLTVGGTGKTPVVEILARSLEQSGRQVAILSRGYKKKKIHRSLKQRLTQRYKEITSHKDIDPPIVVSDGKRILVEPIYSGDEPYMLASNLPNVAVIVGKNRVRSGLHAIKKLKCDTLILDDGFQHLALKHRLDIVLVDRTNPFDNGRTLPRGLLREPVRNIKRAGFIFITKSTGDGAEELRTRLRELNPTAEISECRHCPRFLKNLYENETEPLGYLKGKRVLALSGIAVPKGFENILFQYGADVVDHKIFADHHRYSIQEMIDLHTLAADLNVDAIITTEKDAVRVPRLEQRQVPMFYLRVEIEMFSGQEQFHEWIRRICLE
ncbi:MAG: tetraacyldisaccharide 4'-kinase [Verrucomicrobia bacterium]|nr:tetraacyldisaccharide 4'-kinase [Verrucomicrobiota bacterium]MCH8510548.1 tetraacyldisaccharide 4'-kinase [Kiritimatiellia bacterium]